MNLFVALFISHVVLLVLASTDFSIISWLWGDRSWSWDYWQYRYRNGWGYTYVSEYAVGQVLCYIATYGLGLAAFTMAWIHHRVAVSTVAMILCLLGALSFSIEATHWLWDHHFSWIASFPAVMMVLWIYVGVRLGTHGATVAPPALAAGCAQEDRETHVSL